MNVRTIRPFLKKNIIHTRTVTQVRQLQGQKALCTMFDYLLRKEDNYIMIK